MGLNVSIIYDSMEEYEEQFSKIASLLGDKVRAVMLWNMLDGRAFTASELAICASVSSQSASNHLNKLVTAKLLVVEKQGRHRYYRYASEEVARVVETMGSLITISEKDRSIPVTTPKDLTFARTCYDHLAGKLGVQVTKALVDNHILVLEEKVHIKHEERSHIKGFGMF
ncbi:ArsR/SmtB family transcription factor [Aquimarina hainanensis]|uniref:ArsR/SmtB family transcription factor n=2 Tax=Aquimarina hainanensis TaxID=1578017 RepID=A0ABW5N497_9FLAO